MKKVIVFSILCILLLVAHAAIAGDATLQVEVGDDEGLPVSGAQVTVAWSLPRPAGTGWGAGAGVSREGTTDAKGLVTMHVPTVPSVTVAKDGYYRYQSMIGTPLGALFPNRNFAANAAKLAVTLVRKVAPIPMYVRRVDGLKVPGLGKEVGFDLIVGDWVAPAGKGESPDVFFLAEQTVSDDSHYETRLLVRFPGDGAGLQLVARPFRDRSCALRLPREAPERGYQPTLEKVEYLRSASNLSLFNENANFIFRIHSPRAQGPVTLYGKIHNDITLFAGKRQDEMPVINFVYYFNPTGTRNLEWDVERNLATYRPGDQPEPAP